MSRPSGRNFGRRGGFTLVEALAAGVILALSAVVLGIAVTQGMRSLELARDYQRAAELLDRTLTKVDLIGPARLLLEGPTRGAFEPPHDRFAWQLDISPRLEGYLYEVTVQITWSSPRGERRSTVAQTLLNDPPDSRPAELDWDDL
jgi:type II secretory pathway pseudopilin PulG